LVLGTGTAFAVVGVDADHAAKGAALGTEVEALVTRVGRAATEAADVAATVAAEPDTFPFEPFINHTPPGAAGDADTGVAYKKTYR
jgi:hypothetical protein